MVYRLDNLKMCAQYLTQYIERLARPVYNFALISISYDIISLLPNGIILSENRDRPLSYAAAEINNLIIFVIGHAAARLGVDHDGKKAHKRKQSKDSKHNDHTRWLLEGIQMQL